MIGLLYDLCIAMYAIGSCPKIAWQSYKSSKYTGTLLKRIFGPGPINTGDKTPVIWFHAVSLGESNAAISLVRYYRAKYPSAFILFSCSTKTGAANVALKMPEVDQQIFLPLDFSWIMNSLMKQLKPKVVIVLESEFWLNFLKAAKKVGAKIVLANGKISDRSFKRFLKVKKFSNLLFSQFDLLCMQNASYLEKMQMFCQENLFDTGNLKFDLKKEKLSAEEIRSLKERLGITESEKVILLASTHEGEEKLILKAIEPLFQKFHLRVMIAPRHPERFDRVVEELTEREVSLELYEERAHEPVIIVNRMGILDQCYQVCDAVIMGGSFRREVGGHNILEPIEFHKLTLFGPYMHNQMEMAKEVLEAKAGAQVSLEELAPAIEHYFTCPEDLEVLQESCASLLEKIKGATERVCTFIDKLVESR
jgi:3-deoxy-D-manno-octulosonic-acid transferase